MTMRQFSLMIGAAALAALVLPAAPGAAADANGRFAQEGPGRLTCAKGFPEAPQGEETRLLAAWLTGYVTAHNQLLPDTFDLTPWQTPASLLSLLKQYCDANPDDTVTKAAQALVSYLQDQRLTEEARPVLLGVSDEQVVLYDAVVLQARTRLTEAGFAPGPSVEDLADAVRDFQAANDLPVNGLLDQATLARLLN